MYLKQGTYELEIEAISYPKQPINNENAIIEVKVNEYKIWKGQLSNEEKIKPIEEDIVNFDISEILKLFPEKVLSMKTFESFIKNGFRFEEKTLLSVWNSILGEFQKEGRFDGEKFDALYEIIKEYPSFFWKLISNKLDELKPDSYPIYSKFVDFMQGGCMSNCFSHSLFNFIDSLFAPSSLHIEFAINSSISSE